MSATPTLDDLIAWLEEKPPAKRFDWSNCAKCALGQWMDERGAKPVKAEPFAYYTPDGETIDLTEFEFVAVEGIATFGAALDRARAALSKARGES